MHNRAAETWNLLKPDERPTSIWLAARAARLGAQTLSAALRKVSQALLLEGKIPAGERNGDRFVRQALCPKNEAAVRLQRHTAWCRMGEKQCPYLGEQSDDWIECKALPTAREGVTAPRVFNVAPNLPKPGTSKSSLSSLLKILGPAAITGLLVWRSKEKEIEQLRKTPGTANEQYQIINSILKARRMTYSYDTSRKVFSMPGASIALLPGGAVEFTDRKGRKTKANKHQLLGALFEFIESIT